MARRKVSTEQVEAATARYRQGVSLTTIAFELGCTRAGLRDRVARRNGGRLPARVKPAPDPDDLATAVCLLRGLEACAAAVGAPGAGLAATASKAAAAVEGARNV